MRKSAFPAQEFSGAGAVQAREAMDSIYGWQKHIYDLTRRPYLLGRDTIIRELEPAPGARVLEVGCGTARNLVSAARLWPQASFYGVDVSMQLLDVAQKSIMRADMAGRIKLAFADATDFDPGKTFGVSQFDRIMFSYTLSMIPAWERVLHHGAKMLAPGGRILIADFGDQRQLPGAFKSLLGAWLALFHVSPRENMEKVVRDIAAEHGLTCQFRPAYRGYAFLASLERR